MSQSILLPEILAPAGDMTCLQAALDAGADAVYLGLQNLNMRSLGAANFTRENLPEASARCRSRGVRLFLTLNSLVFTSELSEAEDLIRFAKPYVDAILAGDWGVIQLCRKWDVPIHISTQMSCSNALAAAFFRDQGACRVVLARECTLPEIAEIVRQVGIEVEVFVHGAQCVAESGRCLLSHDAYGFSSNRGTCHQPCRREFLVQEFNRYPSSAPKGTDNGDASFYVTPHRVFSAKDLCSIPFVDKLMAAGIHSFKIEGRGRNPEYVKTAVEAYREAVRAVATGVFSVELSDRLVEKCKRVYHRDFGCGLLFGRPGTDQFTDTNGSLATTKKHYAGLIVNYYAKAKIAQVQIQDTPISCGDLIQIHGNATGVVEVTVSELRHDESIWQTVPRGEWATFPCVKVHTGDKVYVIRGI